MTDFTATPADFTTEATVWLNQAERLRVAALNTELCRLQGMEAGIFSSALETYTAFVNFASTAFVDGNSETTAIASRLQDIGANYGAADAW
jgi:hypothetical protein